MKQTLLAAALFGAAISATAQDATVKGLQASANKEVKSAEKDGWKRGGTLIINLNQGSLSNWAAGGEQNTLGVNGIFNYGINFRRGKNTWDNYFNLALGFQNATSYSKFRKTDDLIDVTSKYGYQVSKKWYAAALINFNSQALEGFAYTDTVNTKISNFLAPGKLLVSLGMDYRPNDNFSLFISPITTRWIFKKDPDFYALDKFGVPAFKKSYNEIGAYITAKYNKALAKWATYAGRLDLFSNYKRNPQNVDVYFTNLLAMKFNKWLGTTISLDMIYDDDIIKKTQLKEILGIGLTLKL
ncbi:DUF3078 domain-containing protein [Ferruginibacter sp. SUN106]|uniref:DUF3078 domain-containing protein n=1 Tax=Ferruginibacter sp. SUN106 TaxID=2978348 RepID=UPI003D36B9FB